MTDLPTGFTSATPRSDHPGAHNAANAAINLLAAQAKARVSVLSLGSGPYTLVRVPLIGPPVPDSQDSWSWNLPAHFKAQEGNGLWVSLYRWAPGPPGFHVTQVSLRGWSMTDGADIFASTAGDSQPWNAVEWDPGSIGGAGGAEVGPDASTIALPDGPYAVTIGVTTAAD